ncbi:MAG: hypothetical protein ABIY55_14680 [Kofleriaceae bacterium]
MTIPPSPRDGHPLSGARRFLNMVRELHQRGYEQLRIAPSTAPSGMAWRCGIAARAEFSAENGAVTPRFAGRKYSSAARFSYFNWGDCSPLTAAELAERYVQTFQPTSGTDREYVDWYATMMDATEPFGLVSAFGDYARPTDSLLVIGECSLSTYCLPPPGGFVTTTRSS